MFAVRYILQKQSYYLSYSSHSLFSVGLKVTEQLLKFPKQKGSFQNCLLYKLFPTLALSLAPLPLLKNGSHTFLFILSRLRKSPSVYIAVLPHKLFFFLCFHCLNVLPAFLWRSNFIPSSKRLLRRAGDLQIQ